MPRLPHIQDGDGNLAMVYFISHVGKPVWSDTKISRDQRNVALTWKWGFMTVGTRGHSWPALHSLRSLRAVRSFCHRKPILYVCLIGFLWYHGVERNISKCMGWNQLWRYLGEYWNKFNFTCLICSWSLSWSLVAISSHFNWF